MGPVLFAGRRNVDAHLDEVFSALRDAGYDYAEGSLDVATPENNARLAERLRSRGLRPVSLYTGGRFHEAGKSAAAVAAILKSARVARDAGFTILVSNPDPIGREKTDAELATQVAALEQLGRGLKDLGMRFGVHNHTPEMKSKAREFHANFRGTKAGIVDFCFDVHWVFRGGVMPLEALRDYGDRVVTWHLRQSREKIWWEDMDSGDVDYPAIAKVVAERRLPAVYTVELALEPGTKITRRWGRTTVGAGITSAGSWWGVALSDRTTNNRPCGVSRAGG